MNKALLNEIELRLETAQMERPLDIDRMLEHNKAIGKNLAVAMYAQGDANGCAYALYQLYEMAKSGQGDLETLKALAAKQMNFYGYRFLNYYSMNDVHNLLLKCGFSVMDSADSEQLACYLRTIQRYVAMLTYWIDLALPWAPLSKAYVELMA